MTAHIITRKSRELNEIKPLSTVILSWGKSCRAPAQLTFVQRVVLILHNRKIVLQ